MARLTRQRLPSAWLRKPRETHALTTSQSIAWRRYENRARPMILQTSLTVLLPWLFKLFQRKRGTSRPNCPLASGAATWKRGRDDGVSGPKLSARQSHQTSGAADADDRLVDLVHLSHQCQGDRGPGRRTASQFRPQALALLAAQLSEAVEPFAGRRPISRTGCAGSALAAGATRSCRAAEASEDLRRAARDAAGRELGRRNVAGDRRR